jgi:hypothetical protein
MGDTMRIDVKRELRSSHEPLSIVVGKDIWDLYVFGVTRVQRDWWVQLAVVGPRACEVTVRVAGAIDRAGAAHEIVALVTEWLRDDGTSDHVFLERPPAIPEAYAS